MGDWYKDVYRAAQNARTVKISEKARLYATMAATFEKIEITKPREVVKQFMADMVTKDYPDLTRDEILEVLERTVPYSGSIN